MIRNHSRMGILIVLVLHTVWSYGQEFALHQGDRVVFYGDSITAQRLYTCFIEDFVLTRYPQLDVTFWNAGVPGDKVYGGYTGNMPTRLKRDMFPHKPTVVTIMMGMNDGYYVPFEQSYLDSFKDGYRNLLGAIQAGAPSARVTLLSPTPYDEITHGTEFASYNQVISRYSAFVKELAASSHLGFSDFNQAETNLLNVGARTNPSLASLLVPDRIHPGEASQWIMAAELARSWGMSPIVSSVWLDASKSSPVAIQNTQIAGLNVKDGVFEWTQTDAALPLPLPLDNGMIQFVLSISTLAAMDEQILRVDGLPAARYALKIDGHALASFGREQYAAGINLALYATPMESQARAVDGIEMKRARLDEARFILVIDDPKAAAEPAATKAIESKDDALAGEQRKAAQPLSHRFELSPEQ